MNNQGRRQQEVSSPVRLLDAVLRRQEPFRRLGVALSGGGDSVSLLHASLFLAKKRSFDVVAIHVFHGLRPSAENEARFCRRLCGELGVPFFRLDLDPTEFAGNVHDAARKARYAALEQISREQGLDLVLTAHTLDDQAETLLQRIIRGTGPTGLAGIRERRGVFLRPWLKLRRGALRDYARKHGWSWCEDPSNKDRRFLRTRLREHALPALVEVSGEAVFSALGRLAELAAREDRVLAELAESDLSACRRGDALAASRTAALSSERRALVLRRWLAEKGIIPPRRVIEDLDHLICRSYAISTYSLPGGRKVSRVGDELNWGVLGDVEAMWTPFAADQPIDRLLAGGRLHLVVGPANHGAPKDAFLVLPSDLKGAQWRPPWSGARFRPRGLKGSVKCHDLFVDRKVPRRLRTHWPLLVKNGEILLAAGLRAGERLKPAGGPGAWFVRLERR